YFDIDTLIDETTADEIWEKTNDLLNKEEFTAKELIKRSNVTGLTTTDDLIDTLEYHRQIREDKNFDVKVLPALRPDKGINIDKDGFVEWVNELAKVSDIEISSYDDFIKAVRKRVNFFHEEGCRLSDHGLDKLFFEPACDEEINNIFKKAMNGEELNNVEADKYKTRILVNLSEMYNELGWIMQFHIGAMRNNNSVMFEKLGPDTGYDSIGDSNIAEPLSRLLDAMNKT